MSRAHAVIKNVERSQTAVRWTALHTPEGTRVQTFATHLTDLSVVLAMATRQVYTTATEAKMSWGD